MTVNTQTLKLNDGTTIPQIGFGTWQAKGEEVYKAIVEALKAGYTHIDTAYVYGNEDVIGKAIKDSGVDRSKLFITTKLWVTDFHRVEQALDRSLQLLGLDYVDLYLMHWPCPLNQDGNDPKFPTKPDGSRDIDESITYVGGWENMCKLPESKARSIGVSNFSTKQLQAVLDSPSYTKTPAANQIELQPYLPQQKVVDYCKEKGIVVEAYSPLGSTGSDLFKDETLNKIAEKNNISVGQVMISWGAQRGYVVLPKSVTPSRIEQNIHTVQLPKEDFDAINAFTTVKRTCAPNWGYTVFHDGDH